MLSNRSRLLLLASVGLLHAACSGTPVEPEGDVSPDSSVESDSGNTETGEPSTDAASDEGGAEDAGAPDTVVADAGDTSTTDAGGADAAEDAGAIDAGPPDVGPTDAALDAVVSGTIPCAIETILEQHCTSCHADEPLFGSPMALTSLADLHAPALTDSARTVGQLSVIRANSDRNPMPPAPNARLSASEFNALSAWVEAGAPAGAACDAGTPDAGADAGADVATDTSTPDVATDTTPDVTEPECDWTVDFLANAGGGEGDTTPFDVPNSSNHYECFYFSPTWDADAHGLSFTPVIDDERVVHHWLLYAEKDSGTPGSRRSCSGSHSEATLVAGWAPGGDPWIMPEGVGMELLADTTYFVEVHYANPRNLDTTDRSGVRVCGTNTLREHTAGTHWLGTETILLLGSGNHEVTGTCTPALSEPAHILRSWPHMHRNGTRMESEIIRSGGAREELLDTPFSFDNQISHETPFTINPGDRITTTCHYRTSEPFVTFGANTEQEMCYNFVVAWPIGAFNTGGGVRGGSDNFCLR